VTCPYCWNSVTADELLCHCGPHCPAGDPFPTSELKRGRCAHHRTPKLRRTCPARGCGKQLHKEYLDSDRTSIAVIGSADSGKSTWVCTLIREFQRGGTHDRFPGMSLDLISEESRIRYRQNCEQPLSTRGTTVGRTLRASVSRPEPLLFGLRFSRNGPIPGRRSVRSAVTAFYDTAGEDVAHTTGMDLLSRYFCSARGIVMLLDPLQMREVRTKIRWPEPTGQLFDQLHVLNRLTELLRDNGAPTSGGRLSTPLAVAVTKVDLLTDTISPDSCLRRPAPHRGRYHEADGTDVHHEVAAWLDEEYTTAFGRTVETNFARHRFFAFSALGARPSADGRLDPTGLRPNRVEDPMLWLLSLFGVVKTERGPRRRGNAP
jgi:hypothetical protein